MIVSASSEMEAAIVSIPTGPPSNFSMIVPTTFLSTSSTPRPPPPPPPPPRRYPAVRANLRVVPHPAQEPVGHPRRAAGAAGDLGGAVSLGLHLQDGGTAAHDRRHRVPVVEVQPVDGPEAIAQRRAEHRGARRRADEREARHGQPHPPRARPAAQHYVQRDVLHRRL